MLLLDENLSPKLVFQLSPFFPGCQQVDLVGMRGAADADLWSYARGHGLTIVSKDNDFRQMAFVIGPPPKVVWLAVGNAGTREIWELLKGSAAAIGEFIKSEDEALLVINLPST